MASDSTAPVLGFIIRIFLSLQVVRSCEPSQLKQALYTMSGWQSICTRASPVPEDEDYIDSIDNNFSCKSRLFVFLCDCLSDRPRSKLINFYPNFTILGQQ